MEAGKIRMQERYGSRKDTDAGKIYESNKDLDASKIQK